MIVGVEKLYLDMLSFPKYVLIAKVLVTRIADGPVTVKHLAAAVKICNCTIL